MACGLTDITAIATCETNGGIVESVGCKFTDITSVTLTSGVVSNFTMASTGLWQEYTYALDSTANFASTGARNGNRITQEQAAFLKFPGITEAYLLAADNAQQCCDVVFIHFLANGTKVIQGLERLASTGAPSRTANQSTRIVPTANTGTSNEEARLEFNIQGNANSMPMTTSLTKAALLAL